MSHKLLLKAVFFIVCVFILTGCGTTRTYHVTSRPEGALVMVHEKEEPEDSLFTSFHGHTPVDHKLTYFEGDHYYITVEKRGYERATRMVDDQSGGDLEFDLTRITGVEEQTFDPEKLTDARFFLLPVDIEVLIHSGVGALDKREHSESESHRVSEAMDTQLRAWLTQHSSRIQLDPVLNSALQQQWRIFVNALRSWIEKVKAERLPYYSRPLIIKEKVEGFSAFIKQIGTSFTEQKLFLLYVHGRCISETASRRFGNAFLSPLATLKFGGPQAAYASDTGTTLFFYIIDAQTTELLHIEQYTFPHNATVDEQLRSLVEAIGKLPRIQPPLPAGA
jgi:hypothetical protein